MPLKWSWAFGPETTAELNTLGQWNTPNTTRSQPSALYVRSYLGSPVTRYSMNTRDGTNTNYIVGLPTNETAALTSGWLSGYVYTPSTTTFDNSRLLSVKGNLANTEIRCDADNGTRQIKFYIDNQFIAQTTTVLNSSTWHHIAIRFNMSVDPWQGELWIDGVQEIVGSNARPAETGCSGHVGSLYGGGTAYADNTFWGDITLYDNWADSCPVDQFVTRISTDLDSSDNGATPWNPAAVPGPPAGAQQSPDLQPPIAVVPVVIQPAPLSGDYVVIGTNQLSTKLGLSPTNIYGVTSHSYASGSGGISIFTAIAEISAPGVFTSGPGSVIGTNTYVTETAPVTPSGPSWTGTDGVLLKTEVS